MSDYQSEKDIRDGTRKASNIARIGAKIAKNTAKDTKTGSLMASLFANPVILYFVIGLLAIVIVIVLIQITIASPTVFNDDKPDIGEVKISLNEGYESAQTDSINYVVSKIKERYPELALSETDIPEYNNGFYLSGDDDNVAYEIQVNFGPDISEFAEMINAYANGVNGAISFFEKADKVKEINDDKDYTPESPVLDYDEETNTFTTSQDTTDQLNSYDSEYGNSQNVDFFDNLEEQAYYLFNYETNADEWDWNLEWGTKEKVRYHYFIEVDVIDPIDESVIGTEIVEVGGYPCDYVEEETYTIRQLYGNITVYMNCDVRKYKSDIVQQMKDDLVGTELCIQNGSDEDKTYEIVNLNEQQADALVEESIMNYFITYISEFTDGVIMPGYSGLITSNGWDYEQSQSGLAASTYFWSYANSKQEIVSSLPYADWSKSGGGSPANYNCTMFAAVFFNDVYGFPALRGNGVQMVDNLLIDCGADHENACPIKFNRSFSAAPGGIISLYPNHVAVITEVKDDGTVIIAEGNVGKQHEIRIGKEYSSVYEYASSMGMTIKGIAIPEQ